MADLSFKGWFAVVPYERRGTADPVEAVFRHREHAMKWSSHFHGGQADITTVGAAAKGKTKGK